MNVIFHTAEQSETTTDLLATLLMQVAAESICSMSVSPCEKSA